MIKIDATAFYSRQEMIEMFRGVANWDDLCRRLNLKKITRNGYWGQHVIEAMNAAGAQSDPGTNVPSRLTGNFGCGKRGRKPGSYDLIDEALEAVGKGGMKK